MHHTRSNHRRNGKRASKEIVERRSGVRTAKQIIAHISKIVRIMPQEEQSEKGLEIAAKHKITIYDALFIALAVNTNQPLITSDREQAEASERCDAITTMV